MKLPTISFSTRQVTAKQFGHAALVKAFKAAAIVESKTHGIRQAINTAKSEAKS